MKIYKTLTPEMRRKLKKSLDSGEVTPDRIRQNMEELYFVEHQDELIPILEVNDKIQSVNKQWGTNIPCVPLVTKPQVSDVPFEHTMEYEIEHFLKEWEKKH